MPAISSDFPAASVALADSSAFRAAALESERRRAFAVVILIAALVVSFFARDMSGPVDARVQVVGLAGLGVLFLVQLGELILIRRARARGAGLPLWASATTVVIECSIPTTMIAVNMIDGALAPAVSLTSPPILAYGLIITLTTLRLRPSLCLLAGIVSTAGYASVVGVASARGALARGPEAMPLAGYISAATLIFLSGAAAAWVANEIRRHLEAALGEAAATARAERMEQDLLVAQSIQRGLLPRGTPAVPGFDIAGWNRPADQTGGDYYDWQRLPDGAWIVTLADVSGHGVGPALVTAACRAYVRASAAQHQGLTALANHVNRLISDDLPDGRFITMASVLIDAAGSVALFSAGHGPIVLYVGRSGTVEEISAHGLPLAVEPELPFGPAQRIEMGPGDVLALVTDGFSEWARSGPDGAREEFGLVRLREAFRRHASKDATTMIAAITAEVEAFAAPTPQQDDLTMVVVKRVG
jgi:serine phosphatase RsbU (regulator of sigma subunit)